MDGCKALDPIREQIREFSYEIRECYNQLRIARENLSEFNGALEILRINATLGLYYALNYFISAYPDKPELVGQFFDFEELYSKKPRRYTINKLGSREIYSIQSVEWCPENVIKLENYGVSSLALYSANGRIAAPDTPCLAIPSGGEVTLKLDDLMSAGHHTVCIYNPHDFHKAACSVSFL
jgi:hypothetical protein